MIDHTPLNEAACLERIANGEDAYDLLCGADKSLIARFKQVDRALVALLQAVRKHFPDACYYTAGGGFHLMLGHSHDDGGRGQQQLVALGGQARISDGDF